MCDQISSGVRGQQPPGARLTPPPPPSPAPRGAAHPSPPPPIPGEISSASLWLQPAHAGAHDHHRRRHAVDPAGVVAGAATRYPCGNSPAAPPPPRTIFTSPGSKVTGSKCPTGLDRAAQPQFRRHRMAPRAPPRPASASSLPCSGDADIDREHHLARDHVARVREDLHLPHRAHGVRLVRSSRSGARAR